MRAAKTMHKDVSVAGHVWALKTRELKDAILDCRSYQRFMHLDLMSEQVPDATTSAKMRHSLKARGVR